MFKKRHLINANYSLNNIKNRNYKPIAETRKIPLNQSPYHIRTLLDYL